MLAPPLAFDEEARVERLHRLAILDTAPDPRFDALTVSALGLFASASIAAITLVDSDRQWFKSIVGLCIPETPRQISFCAHALLGSRPLIVQDATLDRRFADNELVTNSPNIRFYIGVPLNGGLGALCVIGSSPHRPLPAEITALEALARMVDTQLLMHGALNALNPQARPHRQLVTGAT